jgi:hypothetical protein
MSKNKNKNKNMNSNTNVDRNGNINPNTKIRQHFRCGCCVPVECNYNGDNESFDITARKFCPKCPSRGLSIEVVIGSKAIEFSGCPEPGCDCETATTSLPIDFILECFQDSKKDV